MKLDYFVLYSRSKRELLDLLHAQAGYVKALRDMGIPRHSAEFNDTVVFGFEIARHLLERFNVETFSKTAEIWWALDPLPPPKGLCASDWEKMRPKKPTENNESHPSDGKVV